MIAGAACVKSQLYKQINDAVGLWLLLGALVMAACGPHAGAAFWGGCLIGWLGCYCFASRLGHLLQRVGFQGLWPGIVKAEVIKLLMISVLLACLVGSFPGQAHWSVCGFAASQLSMLWHKVTVERETSTRVEK